MKNTKKLVLSALMLALALILPFFTGQIPQIGNLLLPMHLPILLAGFIVGGPSAMAVGAIAPLLRSVLWGMPPMFPKAIGMAFELAVYGLVSGALYSKSDKSMKSIYFSLICAMLSGRIVWGIVSYFMYSYAGNAFTLGIFFTEAFVNAILGIVIQLILIPILVTMFKKAKII